MRIPVLSFSALFLGLLAVLGLATCASALDIPPSPIHKRTTGAGLNHKRVVNSRHEKRDGLAALQLLNSTITDKANPAPPVNPGSDPSKALSGGAAASPSSTPALKKFPELGFEMPSAVPDTTDGWWTTDPEYAFLGFGYEVTACEFSRSLTCFRSRRLLSDRFFFGQAKVHRSLRRTSRTFATSLTAATSVSTVPATRTASTMTSSTQLGMPL
jgi:hypothetical protein